MSCVHKCMFLEGAQLQECLATLSPHRYRHPCFEELPSGLGRLHRRTGKLRSWVLGFEICIVDRHSLLGTWNFLTGQVCTWVPLGVNKPVSLLSGFFWAVELP